MGYDAQGRRGPAEGGEMSRRYVLTDKGWSYYKRCGFFGFPVLIVGYDYFLDMVVDMLKQGEL